MSLTPQNPASPRAPAAAGRGQNLADLMQALARSMMAIQGGQSWGQAVADVPNHLRPAVQSLGFTALRQWGRAEALKQMLVSKPPPPLADALLCSALALLSLPEPPYAAHTLLNETVQAAKAHEETAFQAGFINACLRRFLREQEALMRRSDSLAAARWNYPNWWLKRLQQDWRAQWQRIAENGNAAAPLQLRVNALQTQRDDLLARLQAAGHSATAFGEQGIALARHGDVTALPGYAEGEFSVQDAAAQLAAPLLLQGMQAAKGRPLRVLDACAAPGGKTAHLLEYAGQHGLPVALTAVEVDALRTARIHENLQRLQLQGAEVVVEDAAAFAQKAAEQGQRFDAILLDAPCSASGIVRRHPDVRWLRQEADVLNLSRLQAKLLRAAWALLPVGGRLLYCVCSVFKAEGEAVLQSFLERNTKAALLPSPGHLFPQNGGAGAAMSDNRDCSEFAWIDTVAHDGFYYALLEKHATPQAAQPVAAAVQLAASGRPVLRASARPSASKNAGKNANQRRGARR